MSDRYPCGHLEQGRETCDICVLRAELAAVKGELEKARQGVIENGEPCYAHIKCERAEKVEAQVAALTAQLEAARKELKDEQDKTAAYQCVSEGQMADCDCYSCTLKLMDRQEKENAAMQVQLESQARELAEARRKHEAVVDHSAGLVDRIEALQAKLTELQGQAEALTKSWRCFHCAEIFTDEQAARDHFAIEGVPPVCVDPLTKDEKARMVVVRKLESEVSHLIRENEELDHKAGCLHAMQAELARYFGNCGGVPVKTAHQAYLVHEAMIGAKEAAESREAAAREALEKQEKAINRVLLNAVSNGRKGEFETFIVTDSQIAQMRAALRHAAQPPATEIK